MGMLTHYCFPPLPGKIGVPTPLYPLPGPSMHITTRLERMARAAAGRYVCNFLPREELEQEAYLAMLEALAVDPNISNNILWNRAHDRCRSLFRKEQRLQRQLEPLNSDIPSSQIPPHLGFDDLRAFIWSKLPQPLADILDRYYWQGLTLIELGLAIGVTRRVAERHLLLARKQLMELMGVK